MKILFIDIDGTLLNYEYQLPLSAKEAVLKAKENGHKVVLCTGRSFPEIVDEVWSVKPDGFIGGNGAYVEYDNEVLFHKVIPYKETRRVLDYLKERRLEYFVECNEGLIASEDFKTIGDRLIKIFALNKGLNNPDEQTIEKLFPTMQFKGETCRDDLNKISYCLNSLSDFEEMKKLFPEFDHYVWGNDKTKAVFADVRIKDLNKASGVEVVLDHLDMKTEDAIGFGDAKIDKSLLKKCGYGVAMKRAPESLKEIADYVTDDVDNDGLYKAFEYLNLI